MPLNWLPKTIPAEPYSRLADIYDFVMRHVDYKEWANYLERLFNKANIEVRRVLDISCGTGNLVIRLSRSGYKCAAFDYSNRMSIVAANKFHRQGLKVPVWTSDMQQFSLQGVFEALVCTYDSINYCLTSENCDRVFDCVANALTPGGLFIFDVCTQKNSRRYFKNYYDRDGNGEFEYIRQSHFRHKTSTQVNNFYISYRIDPKSWYHEKHEQYIYTIDEIRNIIPARKFKFIGVFDGFSMQTGSEKSDRVHFVLSKR